MSNFGKKLEDASEKDLYFWVNELDFRVVPLASDELTRRDLKVLHAAVKENTKQLGKFAELTNKFNVETSRQTDKMIQLTKLIATLTIVMVIGLGVQISFVKIQVAPILFEQQKNEYQAYGFCKEPGNAKEGWPSATGEKIPCSEVLKMLENKYK